MLYLSLSLFAENVFYIEQLLSGELQLSWSLDGQRVQRVDSPLQEIFFSLHCKGWYPLWCRSKYVARQTGTSGCATMIYLCSVTICTVILLPGTLEGTDQVLQWPFPCVCVCLCVCPHAMTLSIHMGDQVAITDCACSHLCTAVPKGCYLCLF